MHGWIILDKPHGLGSTQAVSAVKRILRQSGAGKVKVGHGGTLDPLAMGVLPIAIGEATKLAGQMLDSDKIYDFALTFGAQTDTLDLEGRVIATSDHRPTRMEVEAMLPRFTGPIEQAPPAYSAILIDGQRAYDLARAGQDVEIKRRAVTVHSLIVTASEAEGEGLARATFTAHVTKGTYIRSLARDIALALGTVGHVAMLRRVKAGPFTLDKAISLDKLEEAAKGGRIAQLMLPLTAGLDDIPALAVSPDEALALRQGKVLVGKPHTGLLAGLMLAMEGDTPVALVEASGSEIRPEVRVVRGFNL
ncbi:tRNA pseudouridine(55) synthase TruB [Sphingobium cloacae]|uniref:tRNA pseudouridine synthase B n=1 Tax=Sphingobium cloacae TaxID=120107 RepID=A0A1E1F1R6_9SPHN|nr:tRNA pseudouridine(55) synthase TruB [Sphingobium cloacae]BAV64401.1 tRNA pseudouridine synthase B [Sphingobium cloacae]